MFLKFFCRLSENFRFKIWPKIDEKKTEAVVKKTVASNVSSLHVKCSFRQTIRKIWAKNLVLLPSKSGNIWIKIWEKTFRIDLAWSRQMQLWQGCQTFSPKSETFCSKNKKLSSKYFLWTFEKQFWRPCQHFSPRFSQFVFSKSENIVKKKKFLRKLKQFCENFLRICEIEYSLSGRKIFDKILKKVSKAEKKHVKTLSTISFQNVPLETWCAVVTSLPKDYRLFTEKTQIPKNTYHFSLRSRFFEKSFSEHLECRFQSVPRALRRKTTKILIELLNQFQKFTFFSKSFLKQFSWTQ